MSVPMKDPGKKSEIDCKENIIVSDTKTSRFLHRCRKAIVGQTTEILSFHPSEWVSAFRFNSSYPSFTRGDIDGFVALFINNLATLLSVIICLRPILGNDIIYGKILPG